MWKGKSVRGSLLLVVLLWLTPTVAEERLFELDNGSELSVEVFGKGRNVILWLPSEYGSFGDTERKHSQQLALQGYTVWLADLHANYFIPAGRTSLDEIPKDDVQALIRAAQPEAGQLYLFSYGRGAAMVLEQARQWQRAAGAESEPLGGALLLHPNLMAGTARAGAEPEFLPIASATNLPLFVLQPKNSAKRWYLDAVVSRLQSGGSDVFTRVLPGVSDGYQVREDANPYELEVREKLPAMLASAIRALAHYNQSPRKPVETLSRYNNKTVARGRSLLTPIKDKKRAPDLKLTTIDGELIDLSQLKGEVILLNFWATWCPPCVEEIPSLGRLAKRMEGQPFRVISVDVGETEQTVREFLKEVPAEFPVMLDADGSTIDPWSIRAFPTSFVIDKKGLLRYGYFGGLEWDGDEVVGVIEGVLDE